jgi:hypothetical protein
MCNSFHTSGPQSFGFLLLFNVFFLRRGAAM